MSLTPCAGVRTPSLEHVVSDAGVVRTTIPQTEPLEEKTNWRTLSDSNVSWTRS